jgi:hypothetical protein
LIFSFVSLTPTDFSTQFTPVTAYGEISTSRPGNHVPVSATKYRIVQY